MISHKLTPKKLVLSGPSEHLLYNTRATLRHIASILLCIGTILASSGSEAAVTEVYTQSSLCNYMLLYCYCY